ncbi:chromosome partitioning protein ParB [Erwinia sp. SLM-02]|uniref:chromosome partitioning protein ParB n=1 Tax=Erwinia sp. SLM-02 TaxID=3020057 RepID=UPI003080131C
MRSDFPALTGTGNGDGKQMTTLSQMYKQKAKSGSEITTKKTYMVPYSELYLEPGDNIRPLNQEWAEHMRDLWIAGADLPPLSVTVTEKGVRVDDGQHRYVGAGMAIEAGTNIIRIECRDFIGTELERLAHQAGSNDSLPITPIQRAQQYNRARKQGYEIAEISRAFHRSVSDIESHLQLLSSGEVLIGMVEAGEVAPTTAVALSREHGPKAGAVAEQKLAEAKASGKKKLTKSAAMPQFSAVKARRLVELLAAFDFTDDGYTAPDDVYLEAMGILAEYREKHGQRGQPQPAVKPSEPEANDEYLPLNKQEIIDHSGVAVWACAAAAFGEKDEYTFNESKYAHTWAADSVEAPQVVTIPADAIQRALGLIEQHDSSSALREWVDKTYTDEGQREDMFDRFLTVYQENRAAIKSVPAYLSLLQCTLSVSWTNIRSLRAAVQQAIAELARKAND